MFLADSLDRGRTWKNFRQLTTVFGQTRGFPVSLTDGTVVVIHDTRYGPGSPGSRAMISRDEGRTWEDEVYYLDFTTFTGSYNASVLLDDDRILTVAGSSQAGNSWEAVKKKTDFYAIRWKPVQAASPKARHTSTGKTRRARRQALARRRPDRDRSRPFVRRLPKVTSAVGIVIDGQGGKEACSASPTRSRAVENWMLARHRITMPIFTYRFPRRAVE